jgi:DNA-binding NarL/FixJ family response regulator
MMAPDTSSTNDHQPFLIIGRDQEVAQLNEVIIKSQTEPVLVVMCASAGFGKTTLVRYLRSQIPTTTAIHMSTAEAHNSDRPFVPLIDAFHLQSWHADASAARTSVVEAISTTERIAPTVWSLASDPRHRIIDGLVGLVDEALAKQPVTIIVEDLHNGDASTIAAIRALRTRSAGRGLLQVVTMRPPAHDAAISSALLALSDDADVMLDLAALDTNDSVELAATIAGGQLLGPRLSSLVRNCGGSPLIVTDLVVAALSDGLLMQPNSETVEIVGEGIPPSFAGRTVNRLVRMSPTAQQLVRTGAVLGSAFQLSDAAAAMSMRPVGLVDAVRESIKAGLLVEEQTVLRFRHDLVRDAVLEDLPVVVRAAIHADVAGALTSRGASPMLVVAHLEASGSATVEDLRNWYVRSADDLAARSPFDAVPLYGKALNGLTADDSRYWKLRVDMFAAAANGGPIERAEVLGRQLQQADLPADLAMEVAWWMGGLLMLMNRLAESSELYVGLAKEAQNTDQYARLLALASMTRHAEVHPDAEDLARRAREAATKLNDDCALSVALGIESRLQAAAGHFTAGLELAQHSVEVAERDPENGGHRYQAGLLLALAGIDCARHDVTSFAIGLARKRNASMGMPWADTIFHGVSAVFHYVRGSLDSSLAEARASTEMAHDSGVWIAVLWGGAVESLVLSHLGETEAAHEVLQRTEEKLGTSSGQLGLDFLALAQSRVIFERDGSKAALHHLEEAWLLYDALGIEGFRISTIDEMLRLSTELGRTDVATRLAERLQQWCNDTESPSYRTRADLARALARRELDPALAAAEELTQLGSAMLSAATAFECVALLAKSLGKVEEVRSASRRSAQLYEQVGASGDALRMSTLLRDTGGRVRTHRSKHGWDSLTTTERIVVDALRGGLSNRDIAVHVGVGVRTIESHISSVMRKLSVRSRMQIASMAEQHRGNERELLTRGTAHQGNEAQR